MIAYRPAEERDIDFVVDAWLTSYRTAHTAGLIQIPDWNTVMKPQIAAAIARPDVRTMVAHESTDNDPIADLYGFAVADTTPTATEPQLPLVYYVYVKHAVRRMGIARGLFVALGIDPARPFRYACKTGVVSALSSKIPYAKFDPLAGRFPKRRQR